MYDVHGPRNLNKDLEDLFPRKSVMHSPSRPIIKSEFDYDYQYKSGKTSKRLSRNVSQPDSIGTFNLDTGSQNTAKK